MSISDEMNCENTIRRNCTNNEFECKNGPCVDKSMLCDGDNDCGDYSDETGIECCEKDCWNFFLIIQILFFIANVSCDSLVKFKCRFSGLCINIYSTCNKVNNCGSNDFSDEAFSICPPTCDSIKGEDIFTVCTVFNNVNHENVS